MLRGCFLCALIAAPLLGGCWETSRGAWDTSTVKYAYMSPRAEKARPKAVRTGISEPRPSARKGVSDCVTPDECASLLKAMVDDRSRTWMRERPSATAYANGTRQFAYRALRSALSCAELANAV